MSFTITYPGGSGGGGGSSDAADVTYTPTTSADWDVVPDDVEEALDNLAGRVSINEEALTGAAFLSLLTLTTGSVAAGGSNDLEFQMPNGATACTIMNMKVTRVGGDSTSVGVRAYADDSRLEGDIQLMGSPFGSGVDIGVESDWGHDSVPGPAISGGGSLSYMAIPYTNIEDSDYIRVTVFNYHPDDPGTFQVDLVVVPVYYS